MALYTPRTSRNFSKGGLFIPQTIVSSGGSAGPTILLQDSFNRADNPLSLGNADIGGAWATNGTWGILSNRALGASDYAHLDAGTIDCTVQATLTVIGTGGVGIIFRRRGDGDLWRFVGLPGLGDYSVGKFVSGGFTQVQTNMNGLTPTAGDIVKVVCSGNTIKCYVNGSQVGTTITDSDNTNALNSAQGLFSYGSGGQLDDFLVTSP